MYEILIVGGGPAGLTAAIYAARAGKHVAVLERGSTGGQIISAPLVENYPGIPSVSGAELARQMTEQACAFGAEIVYTEAVGLEKTSAGFRVLCMDGVREAKAVILATGAAHRSLGLAAEDALTGCGVSYCALCDGAFYEGADVAVVGGGETALQDALFLASTCRSVTLIHRRDSFRAGAQLVSRAERQENIRILRNYTVQKLLRLGDVLQGVELLNLKTGELERLDMDGLFIAVGQTPQSAPFQEAVAVENGYYLAGEDTKQACRVSLQPETDEKNRCVSSRLPFRTARRLQSRLAAIWRSRDCQNDAAHGAGTAHTRAITEKLPVYSRQLSNAIFIVFRGIFA